MFNRDRLFNALPPLSVSHGQKIGRAVHFINQALFDLLTR